MHYYARDLGIPYREYILMTTGEIEDLAICRSIQSGYMDEVVKFEGDKIPDLR